MAENSEGKVKEATPVALNLIERGVGAASVTAGLIQTRGVTDIDEAIDLYVEVGRRFYERGLVEVTFDEG